MTRHERALIERADMKAAPGHDRTRQSIINAGGQSPAGSWMERQLHHVKPCMLTFRAQSPVYGTRSNSTPTSLYIPTLALHPILFGQHSSASGSLLRLAWTTGVIHPLVLYQSLTRRRMQTTSSLRDDEYCICVFSNNMSLILPVTEGSTK